MKPVAVSLAGEDLELGELQVPLALEHLVPGTGRWEAELGFGKGRYLLRRAAAEPEVRFLGLEMASKYFRLARRRRNRKGLRNLILIRGEALYLMSVALPRAFATAIHVYFPDPWPKSRHHKRRLFDSETVDLVLGMLTPGGCLFFATDCREYGELVESVLASHPVVDGIQVVARWPEGARTNYEAKYEADGRSLIRLLAHRSKEEMSLLHPAGETGVLAAW